MPYSKTLGLVWDVENDILRACFKPRKLGEVKSRREMLAALAGQFDPLGILALCLLERKLILQKVAIWGLGWNNFQRIFSKTGANG